VNLKELRKIVERGENDQVEFKKSTGQRSSAAKSVCAMLNGLEALSCSESPMTAKSLASRPPAGHWKISQLN